MNSKGCYSSTLVINSIGLLCHEIHGAAQHFFLNMRKINRRVPSLWGFFLFCFITCATFRKNSSYVEPNDVMNKFTQQIAVLYALDYCCSLSLSPAPPPPSQGPGLFYD